MNKRPRSVKGIKPMTGSRSSGTVSVAQCLLLSKEYEKTIASAEASLWGAMMRLPVRRLAV